MQCIWTEYNFGCFVIYSFQVLVIGFPMKYPNNCNIFHFKKPQELQSLIVNLRNICNLIGPEEDSIVLYPRFKYCSVCLKKTHKQEQHSNIMAGYDKTF